MHAASCPNCGTPLNPDGRFCIGCGQSASVHRLSLGHLGHEMVHFFTHADKGIFSLVGHLARRSGAVAREYIGGARKRYFPPLNFFLIVAAVLVFSMATFQRPFADQRTDQLAQSIREAPDPVVKARLAKIQTRSKRATAFMARYANVVAMLATPLLALILFLFYAKGPYNYTEHLVANLYFSGLTNLVLALVLFPLNWLINDPAIYYGMLLLFFGFEITFRSRAYMKLMRASTAGAKWKAVGVNFFIVVFWVGCSGFFVFSYIRHGLWGLLG